MKQVKLQTCDIQSDRRNNHLKSLRTVNVLFQIQMKKLQRNRKQQVEQKESR